VACGLRDFIWTFEGKLERRRDMAMVKDPVCGMEIDSSQAAAQSQYQGQTYYFCSVECKQKFDANPKEFLKNA
jgi:YHS domain-containing protein